PRRGAAPPTPPPTGSADTPPAHRAPSRRGAGRGRAGPRVGEEERAPSRPSARPRCGAAGAGRDRLAHAAWNEYDACAPSGCLRMRGILLGRSPRILRLQTVFRIFGSAHSCRIRGDSVARPSPAPGPTFLGQPGRAATDLIRGGRWAMSPVRQAGL